MGEEADPQSSNPNSPQQQNPQSSQTLTLDNHQSTLSPQIFLSSPTPKRSMGKRKKGAVNKRKLIAIEKKTQSLIKTLNPIPFVPAKTLDFDRHEDLLKRIGLWEFVHIEFDRKVRTDLVAQLIVNYELGKRFSSVNGYRIPLNRADLGRALNLPLRKEKGGSGGKEPVVVDVEAYDAEVTGFIEDLLSNWMLLHGEKWLMPSELVSWTREIKDGHPEKVDWAGIVWSMVEKELSQGVKLEDCYYASHMQYLIKSWIKEPFDEDEPEVEVREEEGASAGFDKAIELDNESVDVKEPNVELTLGQENVEKVEAKDGEMMEIEGSKDGDMMAVDESNDDMAKGEWVLDGENSKGAHFLQPCNMREEMAVGADKDSKDDVAKGELVLDGENSKGAHFLQPCNMREEMAVGADEDSKDDVAKGELVLDGEKSKGVHFLQPCNMREEMAVGADEDSKDDVAKGELVLDGENSKGVHFLQPCNTREEMAVGADEDSKDDVAKGELVLDGEKSKGVHFLQPCNIREDMAVGADEDSKDDVTQGDLVLIGENSRGAHFLQSCSIREEMNVGSDEERNDDVAQGDWVLDGKSSMGVHFENMAMDVDEECKLEEESERAFEEESERTFIGGEEDEMKLDEEDLDDDEEEEDGEEFCLTPKLHGSRSDLDANQIFYSVNEQFDDQSNMGIISPRADMGGPSFFGNGKKREISHDHDLLHDPFDGRNKRLRTDGSSSKSSDFDLCMDQIQLWVGKARDMYEAKDRDVEKLLENQQMLLSEVQQRTNMIDHLHKTKFDDTRKKDDELYRLDRELFVMGNLIKGYRDALKATQKDFSEYRERCQLPEEPIYKDVGPGGLVLSTMEIDRNRLKKEEEDKVNRVIVEQNVKQYEEECVVTLEGCFNRVQMMDLKLLDLEKEVSQIKEVSAEKKGCKAVDSATPVE